MIADANAELDFAAALFEAAPCLVCAVDRDGTIVQFNRACEALTGFSGEELLGQDARSVVIPPDEADAFEALLAEAWDAERAAAYEGDWLTRRGGRRRIAWMTRPLSDRRGDVRLLVWAGLDITGRDPAATELHRLAEEHAALRRAATLVARGAELERVCQVVTEEAGRLLGAPSSAMLRFDEPDGGTIVGRWAEVDPGGFAIGARLRLDGDTAVIHVKRTGRPARVDDYSGRSGEIAGIMRRLGFRSTVAAPITFADQPWGALIAATTAEEPLEPDAERRLAGFAELVGLALAGAHARQELAASRARIVEASDAERRRLERNLHDGAQQRLVSLALTLRVANSQLSRDPASAHETIAQAGEELDHALEELRELARGLHPAVLSERGLHPALQALAERTRFPVTIAAVPERRLPTAVEVAAYYVASEALANSAKHAGDSQGSVRVRRLAGRAIVEVRDDGSGGADPVNGSGLRGLADRVEALGGELEVHSPPGEGTLIRATLPIEEQAN